RASRGGAPHAPHGREAGEFSQVISGAWENFPIPSSSLTESWPFLSALQLIEGRGCSRMPLKRLHARAFGPCICIVLRTVSDRDDGKGIAVTGHSAQRSVKRTPGRETAPAPTLDQ